MSFLNYNHLRCFAAVVEEGGVVPAAQRLGVSHPTISEQIGKLEEQLEIELFDRRGRRLRLNENGKLIYSYATQIFGIGEALLDAAEGRRSGRTVVGRIGIDSVLPKLIVQRLLSPMFDELGTSLKLRCTENQRDLLLAALRARQLDLVLTDSASGFSRSDALESRQVVSSSVAFFAHPSLEFPGEFPGNLDGAPFLLPMPTTRLRRQLERWMGERGVYPRVVADVEDSGLLKAFGGQARGVFAMPDEVSDEVVKHYGVRLLGVADDVEVRVFAIRRREPVESAAVVAFLDAYPNA